MRSVDPSGPSDRAGLRPSDLIDLRRASLLDRFSIIGQPLSGRPIVLDVVRDGRRLPVAVVPVRLELARRWDALVSEIGALLMLLFAGLIAARRTHVRESLLLAVILALYAVRFATEPGWYAAPDAWIYIFYTAYGLMWPLSVALWAEYASGFGSPTSAFRNTARRLCFLFVAVFILIRVLADVGIITLWLRPIFLAASLEAGIPLDLAIVAALACSLLAIEHARGAERQRALWTLVPLAVLIGFGQVVLIVDVVATSYTVFLFWSTLGNVAAILAPIALLHAALNRRLIDIGFVLNRALIFGIVSLLVVGALLMVEWAFDQWFVTANHITGNLASMVAALGLGFSMRFIHARVDAFVDRVFFRKRHEDELALRRFAEETAYITDRTVLLERTVREVMTHTQAVDVTLYVRADRRFEPVPPFARRAVRRRRERRCRGRDARGPPAALLERRACVSADRRPRLPHHRSRCAARRDRLRSEAHGDAYAPDEVEDLAGVAHGVAAALVVFGAGRLDGATEIRAELAALREEVARLSRG